MTVKRVKKKTYRIRELITSSNRGTDILKKKKDHRSKDQKQNTLYYVHCLMFRVFNKY